MNGEYYGWIRLTWTRDNDVRLYSSSATIFPNSQDHRPYFVGVFEDPEYITDFDLEDDAGASYSRFMLRAFCIIVDWSDGLSIVPDDESYANYLMLGGSMIPIDDETTTATLDYSDGLISLSIDYYGDILIEACYREYGDYWNPESEVVPPNYDEYVAGLD